MKQFLLGAVCVVALAAVIAYAADTRAPYMLTPPFATGHVVTATSDGVGIQDGGYTSDKFLTMTWGPGQNLATNTLPMGVAGAATAASVVSLACIMGSALVSGVADLDLWYAASGTALGSGTKITAAPCHAGTGGAVNASQTPGIAASPGNSIPAGYAFGIVATGPGWTSTSAGSGAIQLRIQQ